MQEPFFGQYFLFRQHASSATPHGKYVSRMSWPSVAEEHNRELTVLYQRRIEEIEAELHVYQLLEGAIHNIATRQQSLQSDPQPQAARPVVPEPDPDRAAVLATLARAGIKPIEEALAEAEHKDDTEDDEHEDGQDHEDTEQ